MVPWRSADPPVSPHKGRRKRDVIEHSPTSRALCQFCQRKILKGQERVGVQAKVEVPGSNSGYPVWRLKWYHSKCVSESTRRKLFLDNNNNNNNKGGGRRGDSSGSTTTPNKNNNKNNKKKSGGGGLFQAKAQAAAAAVPFGGGTGLTAVQRRKLSERLRALRQAFAEAQDCPHFKVFQNRALDDLVHRVPRNQSELRQCWGFGGKLLRLQQYGDAILAVIAEVTSGSSSSSSPPSKGDDSGDEDASVVEAGPTLSVEEIVKRKMREAEERGEVFEILDDD